jgi:two-component system NtrC family sensor kinase
MAGMAPPMDAADFGKSGKLFDEALDARLVEISLGLFGGGFHTFADGEALLREGDVPGGIWLLTQGRAELFRTLGGEELVFHFESAGRIIGLMSLSGGQPSLFTARARGEVSAIFLTDDEIRRGVAESSEFATCLLGAMVRSMARRNRRSAELLVEVHTLNQRIAAQRDELQSTLGQLQRAQSQIIESERMATLGNLAAGLAHELNNPVAAIQRATDFVSGDLVALLGEGAGLGTAAAALRLSQDRKPLGTADERRSRALLAESLDGDRALAERIFAAGIRTEAELTSLLSIQPTLPRAERFRQIERGGLLGVSLRNLGNCSRRIADLVRSLKLYAREESDQVEEIDLNATIEDSLLLLAGRLRGVEVEKEYGALPPFAGHQTRLQQVWVNLIVNAIQAMDGKGRLGIRTRLRDDGWIEVSIEDSGPGIGPELRDRLFEHRFTTRGHRVEFGLGFGLPICRTMVEWHGGRLSFQSEPGHTVFRVELPPAGGDSPEGPRTIATS